MKKTIGMQAIAGLAQHGVRHVFGIPGVHNLELYRALSGSGIRHIAARHEQGLGFMADGYARTSGRPGVCFTITGPGLTNVATAMGQAYADSIPILVLATEVSTRTLGGGLGGLHDLRDQLGIAARLAGTSRRIENAQELDEALQHAFDSMTRARPRPAYIGIPHDLLASEAPSVTPRGASEAPPLAVDDVARVVARLAVAKAPLILAGGGARGAADELRRLAEALGAPVVMTVNARGLLPPDHPLGVSLSASTMLTRKLVADADIVLAIGTELGPTDYDIFGTGGFPQPSQLVRIDIDADQLERGALPALAWCADAALAVRALLTHELGESAQRSARAAEKVASLRADALRRLPPPLLGQLSLLEHIRDRVGGAIFVGDSTQPVYAGNIGFAAASPGSWFNSATGYGTLGYALPAAAGAAVAAPERPIVCLIGDGGIQFSLGELGALRDVDGWVCIVVWNNDGYGEIKTSMESIGITPDGVDIRPPDFSLLARAYGLEHRLANDRSSFERAVGDFSSRRCVMMLEVHAHAFE